MKTNRFFFEYCQTVLLLGLLAGCGPLQAQVHIISGDPGPGLRTVMAWSPSAGASGYQIYRKENLAAAYPATALNPAVIAPISNCTAIRTLLLIPDSSAWKLVAEGLSDSIVLFNPCSLAAIPAGSTKYRRLLQLAARNLAVAKAAGLAYEDPTVLNGQSYWYRIVAVDGAGTEMAVVADDLAVTTGIITLPPAPDGIVAEGGDNDVLVRWDTVANAAGYQVYRSISPAGYYSRIDDTPYAALFRNKLNGDTLIPAAYGFLDFQRWDALGNPVSHFVDGSAINGPFNGYTYYYKVRSIDLLGRAGPLSAGAAAAMPTDKTRPAVPAGVTTIPDETSPNGSVELRWLHVTHDVNGHREMPGVVEYRVYRFETSLGNPDSLASALVSGMPVPAPGGSEPVQMTSVEDHAAGLRAQYGDRSWWYRIRAVDNAGNISRWSAAFRATLKDITKPGIPAGLTASGFDERIELRWAQNTEPDIQLYQVYRSYCHYGEWVPCPEPEQPRDPNCPPCRDSLASRNTGAPPLPCSGPFVFLGEITRDSLERALAQNHPAFTDRTIPPGSPVCYAYWIKAVDKSGNRSGDFPFPNPAERTQIVCERLRDKTPPEPALISGLFARDAATRVEWIAPPTPDTRAYHVYRAEEITPQVEPPPGDFRWIGGMTVERPPVAPVSLTEPYQQPLGFSTCDLIPVEATDAMSRGFLVNSGVEKHRVYWYKVVGIDYDGNEGPLDRAVAASTFTFKTRPGAAPLLETLTQQPDTCGIRLHWLPAFDISRHRGFVLYKSLDATGPFIQATSLLTANTFLDKQVVKGRKYWYKLAIVHRDGKMSEITPAAEMELNPNP
ncbi:MAG: hypothetical protein IPM81_01140 [Saprospirales bacterium]|nr:hypothetical protein [Saprospirales bacterium]